MLAQAERVQQDRAGGSVAVRAGTPSRMRRVLAIAATVLLAVGVFTVSWERLLNVPVGPYNVKLPSLAFTLAALCSLPGLLPALRRAPRWARITAALLALVVLLFAVRAVTGPQLSQSLPQVLAVLTGSVAPVVAVLAVARTRRALADVLGWFVRGAYLACAFGAYQLAAFYLGLPQLIRYTGVGINGHVGRIAAFDYEPAYFSYFLVLAFGALLTRAALLERRPSIAGISAIALVLTFANVRALVFLVPILLVLLAVAWRRNRRALTIAVTAGVASLALAAAVNTAVVRAEETPTASAPVASAVAPASAAPTAAASAAPTAKALSAGPAAAADAPSHSLLDPTEPTSNAPRLHKYTAVAKLDLAHLAFGVGPGMLGIALHQADPAGTRLDRNTVANDLYLQAVADGGLPLLLLELAVLAAMVVAFLRYRRTPVQPLLAAWIAMVGVAGLLTSYFFDSKVWLGIGLTLAAAALLERERRGTPVAAEDRPVRAAATR